jgi:hypothetical protein
LILAGTSVTAGPDIESGMVGEEVHKNAAASELTVDTLLYPPPPPAPPTPPNLRRRARPLDGPGGIESTNVLRRHLEKTQWVMSLKE